MQIGPLPLFMMMKHMGTWFTCGQIRNILKQLLRTTLFDAVYIHVCSSAGFALAWHLRECFKMWHLTREGANCLLSIVVYTQVAITFEMFLKCEEMFFQFHPVSLQICLVLQI